LMGHPERDLPFCVPSFTLRDATGRIVAAITDHHQTRAVLRLSTPVCTDQLHIELAAPGELIPAALFEVRCYGKS